MQDNRPQLRRLHGRRIIRLPVLLTVWRAPMSNSQTTCECGHNREQHTQLGCSMCPCSIAHVDVVPAKQSDETPCPICGEPLGQRHHDTKKHADYGNSHFVQAKQSGPEVKVADSRPLAEPEVGQCPRCLGAGSIPRPMYKELALPMTITCPRCNGSGVSDSTEALPNADGPRSDNGSAAKLPSNTDK